MVISEESIREEIKILKIKKTEILQLKNRPSILQQIMKLRVLNAKIEILTHLLERYGGV